jgi:transcriptional regulator with GAF, ATPase, and Fis domain
MPWGVLVDGILWGAGLASLLQPLSAEMPPLFVSALTILIIVLVVLPLRDILQRQVDRLFLRRRANYRQLLQEFSRVLTTPVALSRLLAMIADQIESVFHPSGLAIVLPDDGMGYSVALSRGSLAHHDLWRELARFREDSSVASLLAIHDRPVYLPRDADEVPEDQKQQWVGVQDSGVHVLTPMRLRGSLVGWFACGSKQSELSYTRRDLEFLGALADQSCVALENARLYGEMQRRATELASLAMVSSAISSSLELEQVLRTIVESVIRVELSASRRVVPRE